VLRTAATVSLAVGRTSFPRGSTDTDVDENRTPLSVDVEPVNRRIGSGVDGLRVKYMSEQGRSKVRIRGLTPRPVEGITTSFLRGSDVVEEDLTRSVYEEPVNRRTEVGAGSLRKHGRDISEVSVETFRWTDPAAVEIVRMRYTRGSGDWPAGRSKNR